MNDLYGGLKAKKIKITEIPKWGPYLRKQWENNFANHLSNKDKKSIYLFDTGSYSGYLWHLFSYEKKDCLEGERAKAAFNNQPKDNCYVFYQHSDYALFLENTSMLNTDDLINEQDIYIVDKGFNWTYIQTHETGWCGPYFSVK
ncbi:DUF4275 family protein [Neobacillus terrae]|uniref:DUF4275 family protein n=1 Tax=Neobacillus terrae TaxID=3034837 RepID=UPI001408FDF0|nr:DUF4275 family protein [Neobacillus terrae]NHM30632.1 DUF4275 family protein [Neobacillus terrae]